METGREQAKAMSEIQEKSAAEALRSTESLNASDAGNPQGNTSEPDHATADNAQPDANQASSTAPAGIDSNPLKTENPMATQETPHPVDPILSSTTSHTPPSADAETTTTATAEEDSAEHTTDHDDESHAEEYATYSKADLIRILDGLQKEEDLRKVDTVLRQARVRFEQIREQERHEALSRFIAEGGVEDDFDFRNDASSTQFETLYRQLKDKRVKQQKELEKSKEKNLTTKMSLLERLRQLVDSEETLDSIEAVKEIQRDWKATGSVPSQHGNNLWASYHALLERYYTNRSIYFELKELDRRKNLEAKLELCEKAEKLAAREPSGSVIKELNELHEEYRHLGPVPKEDQEAVWQRFKAASDAIYSHRREQLETVKRDMEQNYVRKLQLVVALEPFLQFDSQKINDWNEKTQEILEIQKQWNGVGAVPKEKAKEISKQFWHAFKTFFHHKNEFFKKLEEFRAKNLQQKTQLCERVEALLNNEELEKTADEVKHLQQEWKNIGPVPEKYKNQIFDRFKAACDAFFNRRRESRSETDRQYEDNLVKKTAICQAIEELAQHHESDLGKLEQLKSEWASVGFVPRKNMHSIQKRYLDAIHAFAQNADNLSNTEREKVKLTAEVDVSKNNPSAYKHLQNKEVSLRKRITQLENDIALWRNNIEFFSHSKMADKLREEFNVKIQAAEKELKEAKTQIKLIEQM